MDHQAKIKEVKAKKRIMQPPHLRIGNLTYITVLVGDINTTLSQ